MTSALSSKCYYPLEDLFCQAIAHTKPEFVYSLYSVFQSFVIYREGKDPKLGSRARQTHWIFNTGNVVALSWSCFKLDQFVHQALKKNNPATSPFFSTAATACLVLPIFLTSGFFTWMLNKTLQDPTELQKLVSKNELESRDGNSLWAKKKVTLNWERPLGQKLAQALQLSGMMLNIGLVCASQQRLPYLINATSHAYCFWKISEMKWLKFSAKFKGDST